MWCHIHILMDAPFSCNNLCCCALLMSIKPKRKFSCHYSSAAASFLMMNCFISTALCVFITTEHHVAVIMKANWIITVMDTWVVNREISNDWIIFLFISLNFVVFFSFQTWKKNNEKVWSQNTWLILMNCHGDEREKIASFNFFNQR